MLLRAAVLAAAGLTAASCTHHARVRQDLDPPTIVRWHSIGSARIGMKRADIDAAYGKPVGLETIKHYFPVGTRYYGQPVARATYRVSRGRLVVTYVQTRARVLATTSPRYRTPDGIHAGLRIKPHRCRGSYGCWREFAFDECVDSFRTSHGGIDVALPVAEGERRVTAKSMIQQGVRLASISFGDPDVSLLCF